MTGYQPPERQVRSRILISTQWIEATTVVPELRNFIEHLETLHEFEEFTDVLFLNSGHREADFDVNHAAIRLVIPPPDECEPLIPKPSGTVVHHRVYVLLEGGYLNGRMALDQHVRVSGYMRSREGYVVLEDCSFVPHDLSTEEDASEPFPFVIVNTEHVLGVSEPPRTGG